jgi:hypothetical protein
VHGGDADDRDHQDEDEDEAEEDVDDEDGDDDRSPTGSRVVVVDTFADCPHVENGLPSRLLAAELDDAAIAERAEDAAVLVFAAAQQGLNVSVLDPAVLVQMGEDDRLRLVELVGRAQLGWKRPPLASKPAHHPPAAVLPER